MSHVIISHQHKQSMHMADGVRVMLLSASLLQKKCSLGLSVLNRVKLKIIVYMW